MSTDDDDGPDDGRDDAPGGDPGGVDASGEPGGGPRRKRRRRRRRAPGDVPASDANAVVAGGATSGDQPQPAPHPERPRTEGPRTDRDPRGGDRPRRDWRDRNVGAGGAPNPASGAGETEARADHSTDHAAVRGSDTLAGGNGPDGDDGPRDATGVVDGGGASANDQNVENIANVDAVREGRRRRRRGERGRDATPPNGPALDGAARDGGAGSDVAARVGGRDGGRGREQPRSKDQQRGPEQNRGGEQARGGRGRDRGPDLRASGATAPRGADQARGGAEAFNDDGTPMAGGGRGGDQRSSRRGDRGRDARGGDNRAGRDGARDANARDGSDRDSAMPSDGQAARKPQEFAPPAAPSLSQRPRATPEEIEPEATEARGEAWGTDDDGPAPDIKLASSFPSDAGHDDVDALTFPMLSGAPAPFGGDVAGVIGVRFVAGGRVMWSDSGDADYAIGERVLVDTERGPRVATVASPPTRRTTRERGVRRVLRKATDQDLRGERDGDTDAQHALRIAKDAASALRLPMKVYRVEVHTDRGGGLRGAKLNVYYTTDERLDLRAFIADVGRETGARLELRQLGVRDEAKAVGGIGSCGLTLCCTTWLPDFVPVSIKMAKDQGLVLSPTKVSGQCGRLKCCLVYEQAGYAEMRKGLPKLGKRVIAPRGEGRVVEVDVLRQRVRVSFGMGDTEVMLASEVKPLFAPGGPGGEGDRDRGDRPSRGDRSDRPDRGQRSARERGDRRADPPGPPQAPAEDEDPSKLAGELYADLADVDDDDDVGPTDDPSSLHHAGDGDDDDDVGATDDPSSDEFKA